MNSPLKIAILGSTGSIGQNTLEVVEQFPDRFEVVGLSAHTRLDLLFEQAAKISPQWVVATDLKSWDNFVQPANSDFAVHVGSEHLEMLVQSDAVDCVVAAIVGSAGLASTIAAVKAGKRVALANKETLVMAGAIVNELAAKSGAEILPVDSEHSAVFQCLKSGNDQEVEKVVLTASGGPFRDWTREQIDSATVEQALAHPTWQMGRKITIDSATLMNKALELIEARWLFDLQVEQLGAMIHPQSIVHSMVEFSDGSVIAQMSPPDMKLPIQYALTYPQRISGPAERINWLEASTFEFYPPDLDRFPALELGFEVAERGGTTGAVVNAANEVAVQAFLDQQIGFSDIVKAIREVLNHHDYESNPDLEQLNQVDQWARREITKWILA